MKAVTWQGHKNVRVEDVPDPRIEQPTDAIVRITTTNICGSDLHLYQVLAPFMTPGDVLGHEPMGIVEEVGSEVRDLSPGDRVVMPFQMCCGACFMCEQGLQSQCETTQVRDQGMGAALFGYSKLYGQVPGGQAEYLRVPQAQYTHIKVPEGPPDDRFVYLSDVLPTAWQSVAYADAPKDGTLVVLGLGPIGDMACRIAGHLGVRQVIGVDLVPERLERVGGAGSRRSTSRSTPTTSATSSGSSPRAAAPTRSSTPSAWRRTDRLSRRPATELTGLLPSAMASALMQKVGVDRMAALYASIDIVRRGGTVSLVGVYGGMADPLPMMTLFDKQVQLRMGQANVKRWVDDIMPLLTDDDPLGVDTFATHRLSLDDAPDAYAKFQRRADGYVKVLLQP